MKTEFDAAKDAANQKKHGVSLSLANAIEWQDVICFVDDRADYSELREVGFAVIAQRLYVVMFVQRGGTMRIISLRKANKRELKHYEAFE